MTQQPLPSPAPFGAYAPASWQYGIIRLTRKLPETWLGRRVALWLRKPVLISLSKKPMDLNLLGFKMRLNPFDNVSERRVMFTPQFFDSEELNLLRSRIHEGFQFLDVGANAGIYALFVAARAGLHARIVAVEPQPVMLERLRTNIALNNFTTIAVAPLAVGDKDGTITLNLSDTNRGQASIAAGSETSKGGVEVPCRTLLSLMDTRGITQADAMKIDIEGVEDIALYAFFAEAPRNRWPRLIFIERNSTKWQRDVLSLCLSIGYREKSDGRMNAILELTETV